MSRPALALINTETGEVVNRRLPDDPQAEKLEELTEENEGLRTSLREVALMVVGAHHHHFAPFRDRDDMEDFAKSLKWAETCLRIGLERNPSKEEDAA
jgi:hypothetical protein